MTRQAQDERPGVGDLIPDAAMTGADGSPVRASDYRGRPLVVFFYPKDDTPGCTTENKDFSALKPEFDRAGIAVLGVSKDPPEKHARFTARHGLACPLASDSEGHGLAEALGIWVEKKLYGREYMGMERSTYLIDRDGRIARVWRKVKVAGHAHEVLEAAREIA